MKLFVELTRATILDIEKTINLHNNKVNAKNDFYFISDYDAIIQKALECYRKKIE